MMRSANELGRRNLPKLSFLGLAFLASTFLAGGWSSAEAADREVLKEQAAEVVRSFAKSLEALDPGAAVKSFGPKASVQIRTCGSAPQKYSRDQFKELLDATLPHATSLEIRHVELTVTLLGNGEVATVRTRALERLVAPGFDESSESYEGFYLQRLKGKYIVTSFSSLEVCK